MSTINLRDIQGYSSHNFEINISSGSVLDIISELKLPSWFNSSSRPQNPEVGMVGFNVSDSSLEIYDGTDWLIAS